MANVYSPIGRRGYYTGEKVDQQGTRYVWNSNLDRWDILGGVPGSNPAPGVPIYVPPTVQPVPGQGGGGFEDPKNQQSPPPLPPTKPFDNGEFNYTTYNFVVKSNVRATLFINGVQSGGSPQALTLSKESIVRGGDRRLSVKKDGYSSNVEWIIGHENLGEPGPSYASSVVVVKKYVNGQLVSSNNKVGNLFTLDFDLTKNPIVPTVPTPSPTPSPTPVPTPSPTPVPTPTVEKNTLKLVVSGDASGAVLLKNNSEEIPLRKGNQTIIAKKGTIFQFKVASGYTLANFEIQEGGQLKKKVWEGGTPANPWAKITLDVSSKVWITINPVLDGGEAIVVPVPEIPSITETKTIVPPLPPGIEPRISLLNKSTRQHDIKDKSGLPVSFRKNEEVEAVTVFVGKKHYVFNNLGDGPVAGIVIPSSAFVNVGRMEIKMIPYDLDELDDTIEQVTRTQITRTTERIVEVQKPVPTPIEIVDRIAPTPPPNDPPVLPPPLPPKPDPRTERPIDKPGYKALDNQGRPVQPTDSVNRGGTGGVTFVSLEEYDKLDATGRRNLGNSNSNFVLDGRIRDRVKREL